MTFEEFFIKKKIDLTQLSKADPELVSEFKSHFVQMGEKSFDHSKKFWFNKLRKEFHLKEEPKPIKEPVKETPLASQAEPLNSPTIEQKPADPALGTKPAFKPRFNPKNIPAKQAEKPEEISPVNEPAEEKTVKPLVKPKFTPRNIPAKKETESTPSDKAPEIEQETPKPAYKPKFNLKNIQAQTSAEKAEAPSVNEPSEEKAAKPAYKPKFNPKNIPVNKGLQAPETDGQALPDTEQNTSEENKETKPAYKPRFNMKNIKPKAE